MLLCSKESISFLDTSCSLRNGWISIYLFRKDFDRNQYSLPSSIHPKTVNKNVPYSVSLRILRTCTNIKDSDKRLTELN